MGFRPNCFTCLAHLYLYYTLLVSYTYASYMRHWCIFSYYENTIQFSSNSNMVSEPLLWLFLSSLVFISVTPFSTLLSPSQQSPQPFVVEPQTSSSRRPWVLDLQLPSLRNFTLHRPLPFTSPLQILLQSRFWRYHRDRLAPIYTIVKASTPSETARSAQRLCSADHAPHAPLHIWVLSHAPPRVVTLGHASPRTFTRLILSLTSLLMSSTSTLAWVVADITCLCQPLTSSFDLEGLTIDFNRAVDFDHWFFSRVDFFSPDFSYPVFCVDFIFAVCFCILCL